MLMRIIIDLDFGVIWVLSKSILQMLHIDNWYAEEPLHPDNKYR